MPQPGKPGLCPFKGWSHSGGEDCASPMISFLLTRGSPNPLEDARVPGHPSRPPRPSQWLSAAILTCFQFSDKNQLWESKTENGFRAPQRNVPHTPWSAGSAPRQPPFHSGGTIAGVPLVSPTRTPQGASVVQTPQKSLEQPAYRIWGWPIYEAN